MHKTFLGALTLSLALAGASFAKEPTAEEKALAAAVDEYIELPSNQKVLDEMLTPEMLGSLLQTMMPPQAMAKIPPDKRKTLEKIISESIASIRPAAEEEMRKAMIAHMTLKEIQAMTAFYKTPEGRSSAEKMPKVMQSYMGGLQQNAFPVMLQDLQRRTQEAFEKP